MKARKQKPRSISKVSAASSLKEIKTEKEAIEYLRQKHPEFFKDQNTIELAAVIVMEMPNELSLHSPIEHSGMIACIISLMYKMGTAALQTIRDPKKRHMARIFVENYHLETKHRTWKLRTQNQSK